ncbi:unnamed protein product [Effrenium voratum]|uniref:Ribosomal protein S12 n=1 Tax=Effrenium voratum TaxID=2562239 RepID=A0AA36MX28_9DINO|nr:unnamed protein product [Effrenium voratum]
MQRAMMSLSRRFASQLSGGLCRAPAFPAQRLWPAPGAGAPFAPAPSAPAPPARSLAPLVHPSPWQPRRLEVRQFSTRNLAGRLFYKRRPKMVPTSKFNPRSKWLEGAANRKGVCTKVFIQNPKKPNSGLRKVCYVRLSNGRVIKAYIPGIGHNLQVHSVVMVRGGRRRELIGCNYTCMRGQYDLLPVKNRGSRRSKYGVKRRADFKPVVQRFKSITTNVDRRLHFYRTGEELTIGADESPPRGLRVPRARVTYRRPKKKA